MRRADRAMNHKETWDFLSAQKVGRLGMALNDIPYVVPVHFAVCEGAIYFHMSRAGRKADILRVNPRVCLEVDEFLGLRPADQPCGWGSYYRSVLVEGRVRELREPVDIQKALEALMRTLVESVPVSSPMNFELGGLGVLTIVVESVSGKHRLPSNES